MKNIKLIATVAMLVLVVAACGGKSAEEELLEQILENSGEDVGDVNINTDDGEFSISVEGEDGEDVSISSSGDGDDAEITIEGDDGEVMTIGGGELPDGLDLPVPDGGSVQTAITSGTEMLASIQYVNGDWDQLVAFYDSELGDEFERSETSFTTEDGTFRNVYWTSGNGATTVTVGDCIGQEGVCVNLIQSG